MIDLNKKLNRQDYYLYDRVEDVDTVGTFIDDILRWGCEFHYKNVDYRIDIWGRENGVYLWAFQTNANLNSKKVPYSRFTFERDNREDVLRAFETFRLHDGTLFYDAITKRGYNKYFGYDPTKKYD